MNFPLATPTNRLTAKDFEKPAAVDPATIGQDTTGLLKDELGAGGTPKDLVIILGSDMIKANTGSASQINSPFVDKLKKLQAEGVKIVGVHTSIVEEKDYDSETLAAKTTFGHFTSKTGLQLDQQVTAITINGSGDSLLDKLKGGLNNPSVPIKTENTLVLTNDSTLKGVLPAAGFQVTEPSTPKSTNEIDAFIASKQKITIK